VVEAGKVVLAVDYCQESGLVTDFYQKARSKGYVPYSTVRDLDELVVNEGLDG